LPQHGIPEEACALVAFIFMTDVLNHITPDPVLYCERLRVCPSLPGGSAKFTNITVEQARKTGRWMSFAFLCCCLRLKLSF
jgi:hypothetical protein